MGADFLEKSTKTFKKCWDTGQLEATTADLFSRLPTVKSRSFAAEIVGSGRLKKGDKVTVEKIDRALVATSGLAELARCNDAPPELVSALETGCGIVQGEVGEVHELAGVVEISICPSKPD